MIFKCNIIQNMKCYISKTKLVRPFFFLKLTGSHKLRKKDKNEYNETIIKKNSNLLKLETIHI